MVAHTVRFSAPGKVILFGEHAVVYGHPAIATAISSRSYSTVKESNNDNIILSVPLLFPNQVFKITEKSVILPELESIKSLILEICNKHQNEPLPEIEIRSDVSPSAGLGSSAAVAVSLAASLLEYYGYDFKLENINKLALESEKITHGTPSGIDNTISTYGGGILYQKGEITPLESKLSSAVFVVVDSGQWRNTKILVENVRERKRTDPDSIQRIFNKIEEITWEAKIQLEKGNIRKIGYLMNENHEQLVELGVSIPHLQNIIEILDETNVLGRKITGAGGGGSIIALYDNYEYAVKVSETMNRNHPYPSYPIKIFQPGVKIEE